jgi:putative methyltransferase (TIGR04325 family)
MTSDDARLLRRWWRRLAPPGVVTTVRHWRHGPRFSGDFHDWAAAARRCSGYDAAAIREHVIASTRAVRDGQAAWDRDGTLFHDPAVNEPLLAVLLHIAAREGGSLSLIDFGGALGSTWRQHRHLLPPGLVRRWDVVEQAALAACGRAEFTEPPLRFFDSIETACAGELPQVLLFSGSLQYLPDPYSVLRTAAARGFPHVVLDRTGYVSSNRHRLTVQTNGSLWRRTSSYPCWFFNRPRLLAECLPGYAVAGQWPGFDHSNLPGTLYEGIHLTRSAP